MDNQLKLLAVLAHPDDESMGIGGTLAKYAAEGVSTSVVTATRGQRGRYGDGHEHPGPEKLGQIREAELRAAAKILGVQELVLLDYVDGSLDSADPRLVTNQIADQVRRIRPQVVITFGPEGAYGHPDHIAICQFTTAALVAAAQSPSSGGDAPHQVPKLYYMAWTEEPWADFQRAFKTIAMKIDDQVRGAVPWPTWAISAVIDTREHVPTVRRALDCHWSQIVAYHNYARLSDEEHTKLWGRQEFYRAYSFVNGGRKLETDLFEGLV